MKLFTGSTNHKAPNQRASLDAAMSINLAFGCQGRRATEQHRWVYRA